MSDELPARWAALMTAIRNRAAASGIEPGAIEDHEHDLKVSLPLEGTEYFLHSFKKSEVLHEDPAALASKLYADYEAHRTRGAAGSTAP
jgi:hypothetical protein